MNGSNYNRETRFEEYLNKLRNIGQLIFNHVIFSEYLSIKNRYLKGFVIRKLNSNLVYLSSSPNEH
jgi:hypothetical protein